MVLSLRDHQTLLELARTHVTDVEVIEDEWSILLTTTTLVKQSSINRQSSIQLRPDFCNSSYFEQVFGIRKLPFSDFKLFFHEKY